MRARSLARVALLLAAGLALAAPAGAEVKRLEVLGVAPTSAPRGQRGTPRERALNAAIQAGVERVAEQKLRGRVPSDLSRMLGDPRAYAVRYRILEDRGERPGRGTGGPERVLLVEVQVEADRVERRLSEAGLLGNALGLPGERFTLILEDLARYQVFEGIRASLEEAGASRAVPMEIRAGRMAIEVEAPGGAAAVLDRMRSRARASGLDVRVIDQAPGWVRVRVREAGVSAPRGRS